MGINFHSDKNSTTYTTRNADKTWVEAIRQLIPIEEVSHAVDIGCGGGIYSKALSDMGVNEVTALDFSEAILNGAKENCKAYQTISFKHGNAFETGLESNTCDLLLERALIHHIQDLNACFTEAYRLLKDSGYYILQDRTPEDCLVKGDDSHIRGYFFELFPKLAKVETSRRHHSQYVIDMLKKVGFKEIKEVKLWETRHVYHNKEALLNDLRERTGRSILHELADDELYVLIDHIDRSLAKNTPIVEKDKWTIWKAVKWD
ncbi:class I SAM-dependent methyltransferase [Salipaludibacillus sp. LMS25]|uniref:class I SAM-dependent methyltransferase n=1 Tax=Salipaludibacillus sp. LMS25 TaxID=2924031 RepID=UPI0020D02712|nr:class I SAM-dependent methyltransferase [Salipaludibacillus sp. LMS25]UTR16859.1 class I SAM-dependent methyltransferase [Salipaludibacillus sp. LMS25]